MGRDNYDDRDPPQKPSSPRLQCHPLGMLFWLVEPTYSPFTTGLPTASAPFPGYVAYGPGVKGLPGPTWHKESLFFWERGP